VITRDSRECTFLSDDIQSQVGTSVTVRPAGSFGGGFFERGGDNNGGGANGANTNGGNTNGGNNSGTSTDPAASSQPATLQDQDVNEVTSTTLMAARGRRAGNRGASAMSAKPSGGSGAAL
jgi:hypothetical protein